MQADPEESTSMIRPALLAVLFLGLLCSEAAFSYQVEAGSSSNEVFILLVNDQPSAPFHSISLTHAAPGIVGTATASIVPVQVEAESSDLAALQFDVLPGVALGATGQLIITLAGEAAGKAIETQVTVPLEVVESAPAAQGVVGTGVPAPDPGGVDSDGDGVTDALEVAFGSNPNDPESFPGQPFAVPALGWVGAVLLALFALAWGWVLAHAPQQGSRA
jgi:hypothetical protein